jgi:hypothetical protein
VFGFLLAALQSGQQKAPTAIAQLGLLICLFLVGLETDHTIFAAKHEAIAPTNFAHHNIVAIEIEPACGVIQIPILQ